MNSLNVTGNLSQFAKFLKTEDLKSCRRLSVQFLYQLELKNQLFFTDSEFKIFFSQSESENDLFDFSYHLCNQTVEKLTVIDEHIAKYLKNWKIERLGRVDLSVLRVAISEMAGRSDIRSQVVIADSVEIAKLFGGQNSGAFVNGVLDKVSKDFSQAV